MKTILFTAIVCLSFSSAFGQSGQLQDLRARKDAAIEEVRAQINAQYLADLKILLSQLTAARKFDEAMEVKQEIARIEGGTSDKVFNEGYIVGSNWEYFIGKQKYLIIFERKICNIYKIDFRGRKVLQKAEEWKIDSVEERRIVILRGSIPMTLNEDLTEMVTTLVPRGTKVSLVKK